MIRRKQWLLAVAIIIALVLSLGGYIASRFGAFPFSLLSASSTATVLPELKLRGVWVQADSIISQEKTDDVLRRVEAGHFNAIFVNVFVYGQTLYDSRLADKYEKVDVGFNPLAYLVGEAHRRKIEVHAWLVSGPVGYRGESSILTKHPDWGIVGPDGETANWLNFTRPDVRQFVSDLALEVVEKYGVDGVHFDYLRYPGPEWGFDPYSTKAFTEEYHFDLNELRYADLPAYGIFAGNPLTGPGSAQVLAVFANGLPAVTLNAYGGGEVVVLNWDAAERHVAVGAEILQRSLSRLLDEGGNVYLLRSETNAESYGYDGFDRAQAWLEQLGWTPLTASEADVGSLATTCVLVLPNVYLMSPQTAVQLADFVRGGGGVIFIDGPTKSFNLTEIQAITGMQSRGRHFEELMLMVAAGDHPLIPNSQRGSDLGIYQLWDARWKAFRKQGIDDLMKDVYRRVKAESPHADVSVTITSGQEKAAQQVLQDWPAWLEGSYIDFLVPRGYVDQTQSLASVLTDWQPATRKYGHIIWGLKTSIGEGKSITPKSPAQLLTEISMVRAAGSNGVVIFDLGHISEEQLEALADGPFSSNITPAAK